MAVALPVALELDGRRCLVVGSSDEAAARAELLLASGAQVAVVAEAPSERLRALAAGGRPALHERAFQPSDLDQVWLAVLADRDTELAARIHVAAEARCVFFCAVDDVSAGSFSHLAIARAGRLYAAFGTHGDAPALARRMRELVVELFDRAGAAAFTERLARLRERTLPSRRREVLNAVVEGIRLEGRLVFPALDDEEREGRG